MPSGVYKRSPKLIKEITERVLAIPKFKKHTKETKAKMSKARLERKD